MKFWMPTINFLDLRVGFAFREDGFGAISGSAPLSPSLPL